MNARTWAVVVWMVTSVVAAGQEVGPLSPAESLKAIKVRPGFKIELMAAEPLVQDPIAFAWGPDGKFWVVEMGDYPLGVGGKSKAGGRVKLLTKSREDGPYDKATVFLDNLGYPTGVTPWNDGIIVTCAPDIFHVEDVAGKAGKKTVLFTGFAEGNQQHRVNGLVWGLDNWFYGANGDSGGSISAPENKKVKNVSISGRDFRIRPDELIIEPQSGQTQFGRARDDWGNWFGNNNSNPMWHFTLEDHYLKRNKHVLYPDGRVNVSVQPGASPVYPISKPQARFNNPQSVNHFTSACSAMIYRDNLFGPEFEGNSFVSEPVHNLIHREIVTAKGVTFTSKRAKDEETSEFLASKDNWFRPTTIQTGPDGALWVADMYRHVIEHPQWIPLDWQKKLDLRAGHDKGRIYRIYPEDKKPRAIPNLEKIREFKDLAAALDSPSGWQRDTVQQLIVMRSQGGAVGHLTPLLKHKNPLVRLHALATLDGLGANLRLVSWEDVRALVEDEHPMVRKLAIRLMVPLLDTGPGWERNPVAGRLIGEKSPQVRQQILYSLGESKRAEAGALLGKVLMESADDRLLLAAGLSSLRKETWKATLDTVLEAENCPTVITTELMNVAPHLELPQGMARLLARFVRTQKGKSPFAQFVHLTAVVEGLDRNNTSLKDMWDSSEDEAFRKQLEPLKEIFAAARTAVGDPKTPLGDKMVAVKLLGNGFDRHGDDVKLLGSLLVPQTPEDIQGSVIQALGRLHDVHVPDMMLRPWKSYSPELRTQVLDVLLSKLDWARSVMGAIERKQVLASEVDAIRRQRLVQHADSRIRMTAGQVFATSNQPDRAKVVEKYLVDILVNKGDAKAGAKLFAKHCAACHKLGNVGQQVGPDLAAVADKSPQGLLTAILDPNRAVEARYVNYTATTKAGLTVTGLLLSESSTGVTLIAADGKKTPLLRKDIDELASSGKSAMPEGFEKDISPGDMTDLIAYIQEHLPPAPKESRDRRLPPALPPARAKVEVGRVPTYSFHRGRPT